MFDREQFLNELLELNPYNLFLVIEKTGKVVDFNQNFARTFAWDRAETIDHYWFEIIHYGVLPWQLEQMPEILNGTFSSDQAFTASVNGKKVSTKWQILVSPAQEKIFLYGLDVSEFTEQLGEAKSYLDGIINHIPHNIFWKDHNSKFLGCNKAFARLVGLQSAEEIVGKNDYDLPWSKEESDLYIKDDQAIMTSGVAKLNYEETQTFSSGLKKVGLVSKVPIKDSEKRILGVMCIYTDITALKDKELSLIEAIKKAEQALAAKSEFILNMEHDLRTPFNGLYGLTKILYEDEADSAKRELLGDIAQSAKALLDHCNSILDFAKVEHDVESAIERKFELPALIEQIRAIEKPACIESNLDFSVEWDGELPLMVVGDRHGLSQILLNLISNAIKFTEVGGVKLTVKLARKDLVQNKIYISFIVQDSGIGIDEGKQQIIFEKFTRLSEANSGKYKGLGLGLAVVKKLVTSMGGEIDLKSEPGKGTTFICTLPFSPQLLDREVA